jgi:hypothetical protein
MTCHVKPFGHPPGADRERFHLIAPYEADSREWLKNAWIDQYSGENYRITTIGHHGDCHTARVKTYGEVLREYEIHPESKRADATGKPCAKHERLVSQDADRHQGRAQQATSEESGSARGDPQKGKADLRVHAAIVRGVNETIETGTW